MKPRVGTIVYWNFSGGRAIGKIIKISRAGNIKIPNSSITLQGTVDEPIALIRVYKNGVETKVIVGHKLGTLKRL
jgi:hypothetical protein